MITNLCFEGGGVKGCAYALVPKALEEEGILKNIKRVAGSSAGSIAALMIALKYSPKRIEEIITNLDFKEFTPKNINRSYARLFFMEGICDGEVLSEWVRIRIGIKTGSKYTTFQELYDMNGMELVVTGTECISRETEYFSHKTTPDMEIWKAIRISCAIPGVYDPVYYMEKKYTDGGILMNYPLHVFDGDSYEKNQTDEPNPSTVGFRLLNNDTKKGQADSVYNGWRFLPIIPYLYELQMMSLNEVYKNVIHDTSRRTVPINVGEVTSTDFDITDGTKEILKKMGYKKTKKVVATIKRKNSFTRRKSVTNSLMSPRT